LPINLTAGLAESAVVNRFGIGPEAATSSISEKLTGLHVHTFALATCGDGEDEGNEPGKGELALSGEILIRLFP
jgi:hypothetical protein